MKRLFNRLFVVGALGTIGLLSSCSSDDEILVDPTSEFDVVLEFSNTSGDVTEPVNVVPTQGTVKARVTVTSTSNMRRLYITRNVGGAGDVPYTPADLSKKVTKPDGSIDVESDPKLLDYSLNLDVPSNITVGTVVYKFWATSGKGDYRDVDNSFVAGVGQIELVYGGSNPAAPVKSYTATILAAPLFDGSSKTFISLLNGQLYKISEGTEYAAFWDFGYYYGFTQKASLASTFRYPQLFDHDQDVNTPKIGIADLTGTPQEELNHVYFSQSAKTTGDFDGINVAGDLSYVNIATNDDLGRVTDLATGDIIDFIDNYGKKGIIRVVSIVGTDGSDGKITIDIKVQP
ncbi:MAG TPA: hypothetical protein PKL31_04500 [Fulvivirga sp.]|nr:hypothetical protein [Fulvivirga sp.]